MTTTATHTAGNTVKAAEEARRRAVTAKERRQAYVDECARRQYGEVSTYEADAALQKGRGFFRKMVLAGCIKPTGKKKARRGWTYFVDMGDARRLVIQST